MNAQIALLRDEWRAAARHALEETAARILEAAVADAPYDPAYPAPHLRDTGRVEILEDANTLTASITFTAFYAGIQHEHTEFVHKHGRAKYLERNLTAHAAEFEPVLAAAERRVIGA